MSTPVLAFAGAQSLDTYLADLAAGSSDHAAMWRAQRARATVPPEVVARAEDVPGAWRLLILLEDWCGDAVNTVPPIVALAEAVPGWEARVLRRDQHPALMDQFLTEGARAIPIVVVLDEQGDVRARWGPRPAALQRWVKGPGQALDKAARYKEVRLWYVRDRAATTWAELLSAIEAAGAPTPA
jgi:hypothetical protein